MNLRMPYKLLKRLFFGVRLLFLLPQIPFITPNNREVSNRTNSIKHQDGLEELFIKHGSDKATMHNYAKLYSPILSQLGGDEIQILEIGLGTNNATIPSNMGGNFIPGGSLRALREYVPKSHIYGADIDEEILFNEERIKTSWVDQTKPRTFRGLNSHIRNTGLDVIIIDGLHQPFADLVSMIKLLPNLKIKGNLFVEDIENSLLVNTIWKITRNLIRTKLYTATMHHMKGGNVFQIERHSA
jgi:hypothetical protein